MKVKFELNMAQTMALVNAMNEYIGDKYVTIGTQSYGFYRDEQDIARHGYYDHALTLRNSAGNAITLEGATLTYSGSRNAPWGGSNSIARCFKAAGLIGANEVADEFRHVLPLRSQRPCEEWWRRSSIEWWSGKTISTYIEQGGEPPYEMPDEEYRAI